MKTSVMEVHDMLSVLSVLGVEERIGKVPGVESVTVNYAAQSATAPISEVRRIVMNISLNCRLHNQFPAASYSASGQSAARTNPRLC